MIVFFEVICMVGDRVTLCFHRRHLAGGTPRIHTCLSKYQLYWCTAALWLWQSL